MKNVFVKTLGCKVNTFDSQALEQQFLRQGYKLVADIQTADITVINTCSVTATAEKEARYLLRRYRREKPAAFQVVTGCYAQIDSAAIAQLAEVDFIVPNEVKEQLVPLVEAKMAERARSVALGEDQGIKQANTNKLPPSVQAVSENKQSHFKSALTLFDAPFTDRVRAFVKIQDGCNGFCSYCQIPYARGASRSVAFAAVVTEVKALLAQGVAEIVLTGIHIGDYGEDFGADGENQGLFLDLLRKLFALEGLRRLRISSLEPAELTQPLIALLAEHREQFCEHFHLPLQSGSDRILKLMNRKYDAARYLESVSMIRSYFPAAQVSADVIPGFPGEGDDDFAQTLACIEAAQLASLHVFPYSRRPNTAALRMPGHLDPQLIKHRAKELRDLAQKHMQSFAKVFIGTEAQVLWESYDTNLKRWVGKTKNYLPVLSVVDYEAELGRVERLKLKGFVQGAILLAAPI